LHKKAGMKNITIIDDSRFDRYLIQRILEYKLDNISVACYSKAQEVLDLLSQGNFHTDFIFLDINMPEMSGWEFLNVFKHFKVNVPVYILTSSESAADRNKAANNELVKGFFSKPLSVQALEKIAKTNNLQVLSH